MAKFLATSPSENASKKSLIKVFPTQQKVSLFRPQILPLLCKNLAIRGPSSTVPALGLAKIPPISTPGTLESSWKLILGCSFSSSATLSTFILFVQKFVFFVCFFRYRRRSFDHLVSKKCVVFALLFSKANKPRGWLYFE